MPEQPTIIIQNSNQQNNDGCSDGCGWGCLVLVAASVLLIPFGLIGSGMDEGQGGTVAIGVVLAIVEILVIGTVAFFWLDKKLGWGFRDDGTSNTSSAGTVPPEDLAGDASNYGFSKEPARSEQPAQKLGRRLPHPDDSKAMPERPRTIMGPGAGIDQNVTLPGDRGASERDVYERLKRLKELKDEGHITEEEYATKKEELFKLL